MRPRQFYLAKLSSTKWKLAAPYQKHDNIKTAKKGQSPLKEGKVLLNQIAQRRGVSKDQATKANKELLRTTLKMYERKRIVQLCEGEAGRQEERSDELLSSMLMSKAARSSRDRSLISYSIISSRCSSVDFGITGENGELEGGRSTKRRIEMLDEAQWRALESTKEGA